MLLARRRAALLLTVLCLVAASTTARLYRLPADTVEALLFQDGQLAEVTGIIETPPRLASPDRGFFADFSYERPRTLFTLRLEKLHHDGASVEPLSGQLLVKVEEAMLDLRVGQRVRVLGWIADIGPVKNPGEFDFGRWLRQQGVAGRLSVTAREHVVVEEESPSRILADTASGLVRSANTAARRALADGIDAQPQRLALLETLLLGHTQGSLDDLHETFRRVGMAHILSISGAHLGILIFLVWGIARAVSGSPRHVALAVLLVVLFYTALLPARVPILRATIMATAFFLPAALGRHMNAVRSLALAAVIVLLWKPSELFAPGFQLSFSAVAAIMAFSKPVSLWLWPEPLVPEQRPTVALVAARGGVRYLAVSIAAFVAVFPLVVFHFGVISPLAIVLSLLAWPVLAGVLALGYLKIIVGLLLPSAGLLLSGPLAWAVDTLVNLAERADTWPGSSITLYQPVSIAWTIAATLLGWLFLAGLFGRRHRLSFVCIAFVFAWLAMGQGVIQYWLRTPPAMSVTMLAVGDGSCFLVRSAGQTLVFDCGSQGYSEIGRRSAVPALLRLGVRRIDTLVLSHADLDHFSGVPALVEALPVGRVICSPEVLADAEEHPDGATAHLVNWLREQQLDPQPITAGWSESLGQTTVTALWPPSNYSAKRSNDHSLVLRFETAGRRALLNGDLAQQAMQDLFETGADLRADLTDLPHHGSFVKSSAEWLRRVGPVWVLQSSGPDRLRNDRWAGTLAGQKVERVVSDWAGMTTVEFARDGEMTVMSLISPGENAE